jgi:hypothetical protein
MTYDTIPEFFSFLSLSLSTRIQAHRRRHHYNTKLSIPFFLILHKLLFSVLIRSCWSSPVVVVVIILIIFVELMVL